MASDIVRCQGHEWKRSQALSHNLRNSSRFSAELMLAFQSSSLEPLSSPLTANAALLGSGRLYAEGGLPLSRSYSSRPRLRPFMEAVRWSMSGREECGPSRWLWPFAGAPGTA